ncbi:MAG: hydantoinase/oxoprolinase family protein, partial [Nevskiales bacterium]
LETAFHAAHEARYGHRLDLPVELVNLRMAVLGPEPGLDLPRLETSRAAPQVSTRLEVHGCDGKVPVYAREQLLAGQRLQGPAIVTETVSTTWLAPGWQAEVDALGNLLLLRS